MSSCFFSAHSKFNVNEFIRVLHFRQLQASGRICVFFNLVQVKVEDEEEEGSVEEQEKEEEEENLEKALSVERFGHIISDSASPSGDRMGRNYTEKDFECKQNVQARISLDISP